MKIVARTVKGDTNVTLEVSPADTIASVKAKIKAELSLDDASTIKLIFSGKVLGDDAASLATIGVGESDFLVLMVKKAAAVELRAGAGGRAGRPGRRLGGARQRPHRRPRRRPRRLSRRPRRRSRTSATWASRATR